MKALVYTQPNEVRLQDRPHPELRPGEVVLRIEAVGICVVGRIKAFVEQNAR